MARACADVLLLLVVLGIGAGPTHAESENSENEADSLWSTVRWKYSTGLDYSRGDFGLEDDTELIYVPVSVEADFFPVRVKLMLPFLSIEGPSSVPIAGGGSATKRSSGLGQMVGSIGYLWVPSSKALPFVEGSGKLNAPSETSADLGNGAWAISLQVDAFKRFGPLSAFANFGRKFYVDSTLDNRFYTSVGASLRLHERLNVGLAYDWYQASTNSVEDTHQISPFVGVKLGSQWSVGPYALVGLSDGAPDYGLGFTMSLRR